MTSKFFSRSKRRGRAPTPATITLTPMLGFIGLVTDLGYMHHVQKMAQVAAGLGGVGGRVRFNKTMGVFSFLSHGCAMNPTGAAGLTLRARPIRSSPMFICEAKTDFQRRIRGRM